MAADLRADGYRTQVSNLDVGNVKFERSSAPIPFGPGGTLSRTEKFLRGPARFPPSMP